MKKRLKKAVFVLPVVLIAGMVLTFLRSDPADVAQGAIRVSGNIEITDAEMSFKIPGRVIDRWVGEGESVARGEVIALLDTSELEREVAFRRGEVAGAEATLAELRAGARPQELAQARAVVERAKARLEELEAGAREQEIASAEATVRLWEAEYARLGADYERDLYLFKRGVIAARKLDSSRTTFQSARERLEEAKESLALLREGPRKEQIEQARQQLREAEEQYSLVREGPRRETIQQAEARSAQARESLALAETRLGYATLISSMDGIVLSENIEAGEHVSAGTPVVTIGNLQDAWLRAFVDETDLGRVKLGQTVEVTTDTFPEKVFPGKVSFISSEAEFTPKNVQTEKERVKLVYRIKVSINNPEMELKPGMPADARILTTSEGA